TLSGDDQLGKSPDLRSFLRAFTLESGDSIDTLITSYSFAVKLAIENVYWNIIFGQKFQIILDLDW
ncbi:MAG: hypothetical protein WBB45_07165, partial [Cyclobacteriaceae bacterium]